MSRNSQTNSGTYRPGGDHADAANEIVDTIQGSWGDLAVARRDPETDMITEWHAHHDEHNRVVTWWPDYYDTAAWKGDSIYAFANPLREGWAYFTVEEWPEHLDETSEVVL